MDGYMHSLEVAFGFYQRRDSLTQKERRDAGVILGKHGCWSKAQIANILDVRIRTVQNWAIDKSDRTGGRFDPATLRMLIELADQARVGMADPELTREIARYGTSPVMIARLTGDTEIDVRRRIRQATAARRVAA